MSGVIATFPMFIFNTQKIGGEQQTHEQSGNAVVEADEAVVERGGSAMEADEAVARNVPVEADVESGEVAEQQTHQQSEESADVDRTDALDSALKADLALVVPAGASAGAESVSSKGN